MRAMSTIAIILLASVSVWTSTAHAYLFAGGAGNDIIIVGMVKRSGDTSPLAYGCVDNGTTGTFTLLGNASGLTAGGEVWGQGGSDNMYVVSWKGATGPTHCQVSGQSWSELLYNGYNLDLMGGAGNDTLDDGGGAHDTMLSGEANNDYIYQWSTAGQATGGTGNDNMFSYSSGATDYLLGQDGDDCLYSSDGSIDTFMCDDGTGGDGTNDYSNMTAYGCEHYSASCPP